MGNAGSRHRIRKQDRGSRSWVIDESEWLVLYGAERVRTWFEVGISGTDYALFQVYDKAKAEEWYDAARAWEAVIEYLVEHLYHSPMSSQNAQGQSSAAAPSNAEFLDAVAEFVELVKDGDAQAAGWHTIHVAVAMKLVGLIEQVSTSQLCVKDSTGRNALHVCASIAPPAAVAASADSAAVIHALLRLMLHSCVNEVADSALHTPLLDAAEHGNAQVLEALVDAGADCSAVSRYGETALHLLCGHGHGHGGRDSELEAAADADAGANAKPKPKPKEMANMGELESASAVPITPSMRLLIAHGCNVNAIDSLSRTALFRARTAEAARVLVDAGADVSHRGAGGETALHVLAGAGSGAIGKGVLELVVFLCERMPAAVLNSGGKSLDGATALHVAVSDMGMGIGIVRTLLQSSKVDVNVVDDQGRSPLHRAAFHGNCEAVRLLLEHGADAEGVDAFGRTALHAAVDVDVDADVGVDGKGGGSGSGSGSGLDVCLLKLIVDASVRVAAVKDSMGRTAFDVLCLRSIGVKPVKSLQLLHMAELQCAGSGLDDSMSPSAPRHRPHVPASVSAGVGAGAGIVQAVSGGPRPGPVGSDIELLSVISFASVRSMNLDQLKVLDAKLKAAAGVVADAKAAAAIRLVEQLEQEKECCVCLENRTNAVLVPCGHQLCQECASQCVSASSGSKCPVCRAGVDKWVKTYN